MRHRKAHRRLGRPTDQRIALLRGLVASLFRHERIVTTLPKAKEARRLADRLITLAKRNDVAARRLVYRDIPDRELIQHLFDEIAPRYESRPGGYTRVVHAGLRRGDGAPMAALLLTD